MKSEQDSQKTRNGNLNRRRANSTQVCRECRNLSRIGEGVYHCEVKNRDYVYGTIAHVRKEDCEWFEQAMIDAVSGLMVGEKKTIRYTEYRCIKCGALMIDGTYAFDDCYCDNCKSEREVDRAKINKYLDDSELLTNLCLAITEITIKDYISVLNKLKKLEENKHITEENRAEKREFLLQKKDEFEYYFFSQDFRTLNVAELNPINIIDGAQRSVNFDETRGTEIP